MSSTLPKQKTQRVTQLCGASTEFQKTAGSFENALFFSQVPSGYERKFDGDDGSEYFVNIFTGVKWYTATDGETGNVYYYEMNGNADGGSRWSLPNVSQTIQDPDGSDGADDDRDDGRTEKLAL